MADPASTPPPSPPGASRNKITVQDDRSLLPALDHDTEATPPHPAKDRFIAPSDLNPPRPSYVESRGTGASSAPPPAPGVIDRVTSFAKSLWSRLF